MELYQYLITSGIPTLAIIVVGFILKNQIQSQKEVIEAYKGLVDATNPDKIITLHKTEIEAMERTFSKNYEEIKKQTLELARFVGYGLARDERSAKSIGDPSFEFDINRVIRRNMPSCVAVLDIAVNHYRKEFQTKQNSDDGSHNPNGQ